MFGSRVEKPKIAGAWLSSLGCTALLVAACSSGSPAPATKHTSPAQAGAAAAAQGGTVLPPVAATPNGAGSAGAVSPDGPIKAAAGGGAGQGAAGSGSTGGGAGAALPCDVATIVSERCAGCHGKSPVGGAPMPLVTATDFGREIKSLRTEPGEMAMVASLVRKRINDDSMPMPPGELLPEDQRTTLNNWLDKGHLAAMGSEANGCTQPGADDTAEMPASKPPAATMRVNELGQTCYAFRNHGVPEPGDTTPYNVGPGEQYVEFYFKAPWPDDVEIVSFNTQYDNRKVLHHWLMYTTVGSDMDGTFVPSIGTHLGDAAELLAGWAVGGSDPKMPDDVALRTPPPGSGVMIEWHYYNSDGLPEVDSSAAEVCVVPKGTRPKTAGLTWLGTENFNGPLGMPAKSMSQFSGTCIPSRTGLTESEPIHIFAFWPHMHKYGRHMTSVITRADGTTEQVFDKPFDFNYQITYDTAVDLRPGDVITSTCTFENTSPANVAFGPSTDQEMCYQFTYSYPAGALENGVISLVGASNTCW